MFFTKSFRYALRTTLYLAVITDSKPLIRLEEIAARLDIPRHFLGKILKRLAKEGILVSAKGPSGGFGITDKTLGTPLVKLMEMMGQSESAEACALLQQPCNPEKPCALHCHVESLRNKWNSMLADTTIGSLLTHPEKVELPVAKVF